ncbi:MAG: hypothetical protein GTO18_01480 [Anaerolineales bacterium]|nr:hypothetical protein [Anaerolineales bacterium]
MRSAKVLGALILGVWLLLWGLLQVIPVTIPFSNYILGILAIVAGLFTLLGLE